MAGTGQGGRVISPRRRRIGKLVLLALLIVLGILLEIAGWLDARALLEIARGYAQHWWLALILIAAQAVLFTFALAGSLFLWVAAPLYPPLMATLILTAGGTLGGVGAYLFSRYLTEDWLDRLYRSRTYRLLQRHDNFLALFALRVFPGFPHALVNYSAGLLKARLSHFVAAAILGIGIKSYVYARVIYGAAQGLSFDLLLDFGIIAPLVLLSALSLGLLLLRIRDRA